MSLASLASPFVLNSRLHICKSPSPVTPNLSLNAAMGKKCCKPPIMEVEQGQKTKHSLEEHGLPWLYEENLEVLNCDCLPIATFLILRQWPDLLHPLRFKSSLPKKTNVPDKDLVQIKSFPDLAEASAADPEVF